jgi:hypothetical protein
MSGAFFKTIPDKGKKSGVGVSDSPALFIFAPLFALHQFEPHMENISNSRGKGYCILYILIFLFLMTALVLMLYNRNFVLDFPK